MSDRVMIAFVVANTGDDPMTPERLSEALRAELPEAWFHKADDDLWYIDKMGPVELCVHGNYDTHPSEFAEVRAREGDVITGTAGWCSGAVVKEDNDV